MGLKVVFDTNTVISALVFPAGESAWLRTHWKSRRVHALVSKDTVEELIRVLTYPKFGLNKEEIEALLGDYLPFTDTVKLSAQPAASPACRDKAGQKFIDLAVGAQADVIVSGDRDIPIMAVPGVAVERIVKYRKRFENV